MLIEVSCKLATVACHAAADDLHARQDVNDPFDRCAVKILIVAKAYEIHILGAKFEQDAVELCIVVNVLLATLALDLLQWRLGDVNVAGFDQSAHLAEDEGQE